MMTLAEARRRVNEVAKRIAEADPDGMAIEHIHHMALEELLELGKLLTKKTHKGWL